MRTYSLILTLMILLGVAPLALAHEDVLPYELDGKIVTGGHDDVEGTNNLEQRVFGYDFGEDAEDPYFIGDPGINNGAFAIGVFPNDGLLPVGKTLAFDVLTNLQYWDGTGGVAFSEAPLGVMLGLQRGSNTVYIPGSGPTTGTVPTIGSTGASGRLHVHLGSLLASTDGIDPELPNAPEGVYLVGLRLKLTDGSLAPSDPIYFVYNNGLDEEIHDLAMDYVQTTLVPEPGAFMLLAMAGCLIGPLAWRKRLKTTVASS